MGARQGVSRRSLAVLSRQLLYRASHDLDVATSAMSGFDFATRFVPWIDAQRNRGADDEPLKATTVACISANPDQSKHLETATAKVLGFELDFVQLRSESYAQESRIPTVVRGMRILAQLIGRSSARRKRTRSGEI